MKAIRKTIFNQPSWRLANREVDAWLTETGGMLAPVTFSFGRRKITPFSVAPWHGEKLDRATPPIIKALRGDFFCMPFGANSSAFGKEKHPLHGECANGKWKLDSFDQSPAMTRICCSLSNKVRKSRVAKTVELHKGHRAIYQRHVISGGSGPMTFGHHAMLKFPDAPASGILSTSRMKFGRVFPEPVERPENRGYSMLKPGAEFASIEFVPTITGETADLSHYPARRGFEDLVILAGDDSLPLAWSAVVFPAERYVWFALRDPKVLASTILWISNGGRHYTPWSGRHVNVMGIEDVTANFHYGLAESAAPNDLSRRGVRTSVQLDSKSPLVVNYIMGVADAPAGFDRVAEITTGDGSITLSSDNGTSMAVPLDISWLRGAA